MNRTTVAIIGAGAVGLYLAWRLALKGNIVVVYEKRKTIKAKACSGLVSDAFLERIPGLVELAENKINTCFIHFPQKTIRLHFSSPHFVICRQKINEYLFELALSAGVSFVFSHPFKRIANDINRFGRVVGCDGAHSAVRKWLRLPDPSMRLGIQALTEEKDYSSRVDVWPVGSGFFWRIPRGECVEYGILGDRFSANKDFSKYIKELGVKNLYSIHTASIPCGIVLPVHNKITLCGDAAGLTKPWSGGGLLWGIVAGDILVETFPDFTAYTKKVSRIFVPQIFWGKKITQVVYWLGHKAPFLLANKFVERINYNNDFLPFIF